MNLLSVFGAFAAWTTIPSQSQGNQDIEAQHEDNDDESVVNGFMYSFVNSIRYAGVKMLNLAGYVVASPVSRSHASFKPIVEFLAFWTVIVLVFGVSFLGSIGGMYVLHGESCPRLYINSVPGDLCDPEHVIAVMNSVKTQTWITMVGLFLSLPLIHLTNTDAFADLFGISPRNDDMRMYGSRVVPGIAKLCLTTALNAVSAFMYVSMHMISVKQRFSLACIIVVLIECSFLIASALYNAYVILFDDGDAFRTDGDTRQGDPIRNIGTFRHDARVCVIACIVSVYSGVTVHANGLSHPVSFFTWASCGAAAALAINLSFRVATLGQPFLYRRPSARRSRVTPRMVSQRQPGDAGDGQGTQPQATPGTSTRPSTPSVYPTSSVTTAADQTSQAAPGRAHTPTKVPGFRGRRKSTVTLDLEEPSKLQSILMPNTPRNAEPSAGLASMSPMMIHQHRFLHHRFEKLLREPNLLVETLKDISPRKLRPKPRSRRRGGRRKENSPPDDPRQSK